MFKAEDFCLDWRQEFETLSPYLEGAGGMIVLEYASDKAAPLKFNHLLKERFSKPENGNWLSLRVDHEWFTTRQVAGVIDQIDRLLAEAGIQVESPSEEQAPVQILKGVEVGGNMTTAINELHIDYAPALAGRALRARAEAVFEAIRNYVSGRGRLMVILNDMPIPDQTDFWQQIWNAGLSAAGGDSLLLVIHAGPKAGRRRHHDSPEPNERIILPDEIEDGSARDNHFFDDLVDAFSTNGVQEPTGPAGVHLENNRASILYINMKLSAAIMSAKKGQERRKA